MKPIKSLKGTGHPLIIAQNGKPAGGGRQGLVDADSGNDGGRSTGKGPL